MTSTWILKCISWEVDSRAYYSTGYYISHKETSVHPSKGVATLVSVRCPKCGLECKVSVPSVQKLRNGILWPFAIFIICLVYIILAVNIRSPELEKGLLIFFPVMILAGALTFNGIYRLVCGGLSLIAPIDYKNKHKLELVCH